MVAAKDLIVTLTVGDLEELVTNAVNDALSGLNDFSEKKSPTVFKKYLNKHDTCEYLNISMFQCQLLTNGLGKKIFLSSELRVCIALKLMKLNSGSRVIKSKSECKN